MSDALDLTGLVEQRNQMGTRYFTDSNDILVAKQCTRCLDIKSLTEFTNSKRGFRGKHAGCKACAESYGKKNVIKISESKQRWIENNPMYFKNYHHRNKEKRRDYDRIWYEENKERRLGAVSDWRQRNQEKKELYDQRRRAKKALLPNDFSRCQQKATLEKFSEGCALSGDFINRTWDHAIPLNSGHGGTTYGNMYPLRGDLNSSKGDRNIFEWFKANRQRFNLSQAKFDALIDWLAEINDMTVEEYTSYVYECHGDKYESEAI